ncbi:GNAT family N-acetyltransferase [Acidipropionibacterium jensenii]|uniref:N-acetyltransferase domain-containing protein n=1 Tax=Acidipropionibacterium jensenii TaxID=1749 RepID=A0A448P083_9ACTN|nr:GNAT family N-acetyltransferase [Acidipropionibacterium jensenii]MDN5978479.1 N-acetyltransferase [Acidipropionibacterium jensenii]MDN6426221.1 N-acetyltransferase [Acidipropionibacterium jensenii]MDN6442798.1 N-acetyltransferase [Acidipropionibacterium jensenii]MDN6479927.1 N-acetyltransferase [Acidipropionibacterium jensenii]MDN6513893.1 N-acetyltransferase [Acidipropionibacterium jensenii]
MAEPTITDNTAEHRYEAHLDGELAGYLVYEQDGEVVDLPHTKVFSQYEGKGVAGALVRHGLDDIRARGGLTVTPTCPYVEKWIQRHPDYADLVHQS